MSNWTCAYLLSGIAGAVLALLYTPLFRRIALKTDFMDVPGNNHKGHRKATPLLGGGAIYLAWISAIGLCLLVAGLGRAGLVPYLPELDALHLDAAYRRLSVLVIGGTLALLLGLIDDKIALSAGVKFSGQLVIALLTVLIGGIRFQLAPELPQLSCGFTVFWIMLMMNSINFFDNMDGLAIGTVAIAMALFAVIAGLNNQYLIAGFAAMNCGVACGFWFYNASPASIFMGDSGSHFVGYLAAVVAAQVTFFDKSYSLSRFPVLMPLFILALPLFDTAMVILIRTVNKKPFWIGDHNHISHRFVRMGLSRPQAVLLVHLLALTIGLGILPVFWGKFLTAVLLVLQSLLILLVITLLQLWLSKKPDARE